MKLTDLFVCSRSGKAIGNKQVLVRISRQHHHCHQPKVVVTVMEFYMVSKMTLSQIKIIFKPSFYNLARLDARAVYDN